MPANAAWYNDEKNLILVTISSPFTWDEFFQAGYRSHLMLVSMARPAPIVADMRLATVIPAGALPNLRRLVELDHPNKDKIIFIGAHLLLRNVFESLHRLYNLPKRPVLFVETMDEALTLLSISH